MNSQIQNFYPSFAPNQVLTDTQLNHMRIYLDEQNRLTRTRMIGTGIICGLHAKYEFSEPKIDQESHTITISKGYGVTSEGYLLDFEGDVYTKYRRYEGLDADEDESTDYEPLREAIKTNKVFELVSTKDLTGPDKALYTSDPNNPVKELSETEIDTRILVLYLECKSTELSSCSVSDCSNKGQQVEFKVKALLVHENDLESVLPSGRLTDKLTHLRKLLIHVPRFHHAIEGPDDHMSKMELIEEADGIRYAYGMIVHSTRNDFLEKFNKLITDNNDRGNFLNLPDTSEIENILKDHLPELKSANDFNQYHYGFLRDLACGFNEFLAAYCKLVKDCGPQTGYPKHLMLRRLIEDTPGDNGGYYRHSFVPTPVRNVMHGSWLTTRNMFLRLTAMIENFRSSDLDTYENIRTFGDRTGIRITPSQDALHPLAVQAIPYYYNTLDTSISTYWQAANDCTLNSVNSYYYQEKDMPDSRIPNYPDSPLPDYSTYPLYYGIRENSFYRIEGHLGRNCEEVKKKLEELCQIHNLDFNVHVLYTSLPPGYSKDKELFKDFAARKWGMEYEGGVKPGGTFILVCDPDCPDKTEDDIIVADFSLDCCIEKIENCPKIDSIILELEDSNSSAGYYSLKIEVSGADPDKVIVDWGDGSDEEEISDLDRTTHTYTFPQTGTLTHTVIVTVEGPGTCETKKEQTVIVTASQETETSSTVEAIAVPIQTVEVQKSRSIPARPKKSAKIQNLGPRRQARIKSIYKFNEGGDYNRNRTYQSAQEFVSDEKITAAKLNPAFKDVLGKLKSVYKRTSGQKQVDYQGMLMLVTQAFMDRLVELAPSALPTAAKQTLTDEILDLKSEFGIKPADLKKAWKAAEVKKITDAKVVDQIQKLIK